MPGVLVVDDDAAFRGLARRLLIAAGLRVVGEADGVATALAAARELRPDGASDEDIRRCGAGGFFPKEKLVGAPLKELLGGT